MAVEIPCLRNIDLNCPETCPDHQESKEIVEKGAKELDIPVTAFVQRLRSARSGSKLLVSADLINSGLANNCVQKDLCEVAFIEVKKPSNKTEASE